MKNSLYAFVAIIGTFLIADPTIAHEISYETIVEVRASTVSLLPKQLSKRQLQEEPEGTGFIIMDGSFVVTANHVLGISEEVLVRTQKGKIISATVFARDPETDIAILKLPIILPPLQFSAEVALSQSVCAIGNSFGLGLSVSCGIVSAVNRSGIGFNSIEDFVQTDAAVNPGMSGGPLINRRGEVVGLLSAIFTKNSDANIGVNFAVSGALVQTVVNDLLDNGSIDRRPSGLLLQQEQGNNDAGMMGARVIGVKPDTPEAKAGITVDDVILAVSGVRLIKAPAYKAIIAKLQPPSNLILLLYRDGKTLEVKVEFPQRSATR